MDRRTDFGRRYDAQVWVQAIPPVDEPSGKVILESLDPRQLLLPGTFVHHVQLSTFRHGRRRHDHEQLIIEIETLLDDMRQAHRRIKARNRPRLHRLDMQLALARA